MDDLSAARIGNLLLATRFVHVEVHAAVPSTQSLLVAEGGRDGRVIVADHQTAGRGRAGRSWTDLPGRMLMFSALLRDVDAPALLSLAAGVAVARAVDALGVRSDLKWPNDVRIDGRKVCGVLGELAPSGDYAVIGVGVNVSHDEGELPAELGSTSIRIALGTAPRRDELCGHILLELDKLTRGAGWLDEYRDRCETIGSRVRIELGDGSFEGTATEVRDDGALVVDRKAVVAGDVIHLKEGG